MNDPLFVINPILPDHTFNTKSKHNGVSRAMMIYSLSHFLELLHFLKDAGTISLNSLINRIMTIHHIITKSHVVKYPFGGRCLLVVITRLRSLSPGS